MPSTLADVPFIIRQIEVCLSIAKQCHDPEIEGLLLKLARALAARALELGADPKTIPLVEPLTACSLPISLYWQREKLGGRAMPDREHVAKIVSAYAKRNALAADQLPALIATVHGALASIEGGGQPEPAIGPEPAVPIRRSIQPEAIICLDCGHRQKMLKRHLTTAHQLTPDEYRKRWGLKSDYPMVAPNYTARRSELAKSYGFGRR